MLRVEGTLNVYVLVSVGLSVWGFAAVHRQFIFKGDTSTHAQGTDLEGGLVERIRARRHCGPLCSKLVAAVSGSICIAVVSVSVGVIVLSKELL